MLSNSVRHPCVALPRFSWGTPQLPRQPTPEGNERWRAKRLRYWKGNF
jgi:hypothetical protein